MSSAAVKPRSEIQAQYTWNDSSLYSSRADWQADFEAVAADIPQISQYQGKLGESADTLLGYLQAFDELAMRVVKLYVYTTMASNVDTDDQEAAAMDGQAQGLIAQAFAAAAFANPELLQVGLDKLNQWMDSNPDLAIYRHYIESLYRQQEHVRSPEVEQLLGMLYDPFASVGNIASMLANADLPFPQALGSDGQQVQITQSNMDTLLNSPDRELRRSAWEGYADTYLQFKNSFAASYLTSVKQDVFNMRARHYESSLEAALFGNKIPTEVFHNLINTYQKHLPTWHRYWAVRRKALGVDRVHPYDIWAPIATEQPVLSYEDAVDYISAGMEPLGQDYVSILRRGALEDRWVDVYPNQGKRQGAFSSGSKGTHPFIMMSFDDSLGAMSTLAHELGHSMHSYFTTQHQPFTYTNYSMFVAEVASNFNQALVRAHLLASNDDPQFQIAVIEEAMDNFHRYFFIMPTLARFELAVHERVEQGRGMTADEMIDLMARLFGEGYGSELDYDHARTGITWAQFSHLYVNYYTFQYATGISAAHALAQDILAGDSAKRDAYLELLKAGSSIYPIDALQMAGVDMSTPDAVEKTFAVLESYVDRLDKLVDSL